MSLFDAEVVEKLKNAGYDIAGKANVGEFAFDFLGETSFFGAVVDQDGKLCTASAKIVKNDEASVAVSLDVNGAPRRAAALENLVNIKPTYGTVSRFGTVAVACSGECVSITAKSVENAKDALSAIIGHDDNDGTSLSSDECAKLDKNASFDAPKKVAIAKSLYECASAETKAKVDAAKEIFAANGIEIAEIDDSILAVSNIAWNILMCAELCNNVSRYDGVKYGYRSKNYKNIDELYTNSRTEAFGDLLKTAILYGSETLSTENYQKVYDKALRIRRVICEKFAEIFSNYDAVLMPACSKAAYTEADIANAPYVAFEENKFTAPASISGLPAVVAGGVQLMGKAFSENTLLALAEMLCKEVR